MAARVDNAIGALPQPSALQTLFDKERESYSSPHPLHLRQLAQQIAHNLEFQHLWTDVQIHDYAAPGAGDENLTQQNSKLLPRPLISGLPPQRLYIHPDEQIALLQAQKAVGGTGMGEVLPEREWVCPSHLREKWSLRRFGEVFDHITLYPPEIGEEEDEALMKDHETKSNEVAGTNGMNNRGHGDSAQSDFNEWRTTKRVLLATLDDDSTIVYYIVHDGIVKPRQN